MNSIEVATLWLKPHEMVNNIWKFIVFVAWQLLNWIVSLYLNVPTTRKSVWLTTTCSLYGKMRHDMLKGLYEWCVKKDFHVIQRFKTRGIENGEYMVGLSKFIFLPLFLTKIMYELYTRLTRNILQQGVYMKHITTFIFHQHTSPKESCMRLLTVSINIPSYAHWSHCTE